MALLAENYKKLEKSGKLKSWNLGKLKTSKRSPFMLGKFSKSYQALNRRFRSEFSRSKYTVDREAHSDNEDSDLSSAMPLLHSHSAHSLNPPTKPPRTFKQRKLDLTGDGDGSPSLFDSSNNFSRDVLSAIKEMGVVYTSTEDEGKENVEVGEEDSNESREERLTHSLPNGGFRILTMDEDSSLPRSGSPGLSHSPKALLTQLSDPSSGESPTPPSPPSPPPHPPPHPPLSPVSEGEGLAEEKEGEREDVVGEGEGDGGEGEGDGEEGEGDGGEGEGGGEEGEGDGGEGEGDGDGGHVLMSPLSADLPAVFLDLPSEHPGDQREEDEEGEVIMKGSPVVSLSGVAGPTPNSAVCTASPSGTASIHDDHPPTSADSPSALVTLRQRQQQTMHWSQSEPHPPAPAKELSVSDINLRFNPKRASVASVATEWYSADEDEEDDLNLSDSPELRETLTLLSSGANLLDDELGLFSTPPSSPPLGPHNVERGSPQPHSPSPLEICQRGAGDQEGRRNLEDEGPRPLSVSSADYDSQKLPEGDLLGTRVSVDGEGVRSVDGKGVRSGDGKGVRSVDGEGVRSVDGEGVRSVDGEGVRSVDGEGMRSVDGEGVRSVVGVGVRGVDGEDVRGVDGEGVRSVDGEGVRSEDDDRRDIVDGEFTSTGTLKRHHLPAQKGHNERGGGSEWSPAQGGHNERGGGSGWREERESSLQPSINSLEDSVRTIGPEDECHTVERGEQTLPAREVGRDAGSTDKDSSSSVVSQSGSTTLSQRQSTAVSHSADTSPNWNDSRLSTFNTALTRSATDVISKTSTGDSMVTHQHLKRSLTTVPQRSTCSRIVPRNSSCSEDFFSKHDKSEDLVGSFSEQDIAEILKSPAERVDSVPDTSSTTGSIPTLTIESAEEEEGGEKEGGRGGEGEGNTGGGREEGGQGGGGGREEGVDASLQVLSPVSSGSREVSPESVDPVIIPDTISPSMVHRLLGMQAFLAQLCRISVKKNTNLLFIA